MVMSLCQAKDNFLTIRVRGLSHITDLHTAEEHPAHMVLWCGSP